MSVESEITIPALAKLLGVSRITVYKRVKRGDIPARRIGRTYVITDKTVTDILGKQTNKTTKAKIEAAVKKTVADYGDLLKQLGRE